MPEQFQGDSNPVHQLSAAELVDNLASYILGSWLHVPENESYKESVTAMLGEAISELKTLGEQTACDRLKGKTLRVQLFLANHDNTPEHVLDLLAGGEHAAVVCRVAEHPRTTLSTLERLASHDSAEVRSAVAQNRNASEQTIRKLLEDTDPTVRYDLAESYHLPKDVLTALAADENPYVACRAAQTLSRLSTGDSPAGTRTIAVYLVEDSDFLRSCLQMQVESTPGMEVAGYASEGKQAMEQIMALRPDLVLMDIGLPGMDGITITRAVKEAWPDSRIIMLTGHDSEDEILAAFDAGADGYFLKTSDYRLLDHAAEAVLGGGTWVDPAVAPTLLRHVIDRVIGPSTALPSTTEQAEPVMALLKLSSDRRKKGKFEQAVSICESAVMVAETEYGTAHELTALALAQLADLHYSRAAYSDCEPFYLKLLMSKRQSLKPSSCRLERDLLALARLADMSGNKERASSIMDWYQEITDGEGKQSLDADARDQFRMLLDSSDAHEEEERNN